MDTIVKCVGIKKYFPINNKKLKGKNHFLHAVDDVSFEIHKRDIFGIVGESGSGKSTIGRCILNLHKTTEGEIWYEDKQINNLTNKEFREYRSKMQMVFQNPFASFNPKKSIQNMFVELGRSIGLNRQEAIGRASELLEMVGLLPQFEILRRYPKEMSGGQLQRLAIARALMLGPELLIADEPVSALDVSVQAQILNLFVELRNKLGLTILFVSHDLTVVENICDMVAVLYLGVVVELAPPEKLFGNILHPYSEALISAKPKNHPTDESKRIILEGDIPSAVDVEEGCRFADRCRYCKGGKCRMETPKLQELEDGHYVACHYPLINKNAGVSEANA